MPSVPLQPTQALRLRPYSTPSYWFYEPLQCSNAFESIKALLCHAPVLAAPDFEHSFKLEVDASAVGAGTVLLQDDSDGVEHPLSFFSRKFNNQLHCSVIIKEMLALLWVLLHFGV